MSVLSYWRIALCAAASPVFLVLALGFAQPVHAAELDVNALRAAIDGVYVLDEWHTDAGVFRPPQIDGRFVVLNGKIVLELYNRISDSSQITSAGHGTYVLGPAEFFYGYDAWSSFTETSSGISVSHKLPWQGLRTFAASREGESVALRTTAGEELLFGVDGIRYALKGKILRVWRRVPSAH